MGCNERNGNNPERPLSGWIGIKGGNITWSGSRRRGQYRCWYQETEKQLLSQGHRTAITNTERLLPTYRLEIIGHFNKWITSHFDNTTLIMFTNLALLISYVYLNCILYHVLHLAHAARSLLIHIFICIYIK